ncbi:MAG: ERF family protein [Actinomycetota bacterium]
MTEPQQQWAEAFVTAWAELPPVEKTKTATIPTKTGGSFTYTYADLATVIAAVRPVFAKHGLAVTQSAVDADEGVGIITRIIHKGGWTETYGPTVVPFTGDARSAGGAITYARRYGLTAALGIATDDDTDAAPIQDHRTGKAPATGGPLCPSCGSGLLDQRDLHEADPKKPAWKCSNKTCQGGNPKKDGGGNWPWASWHTEPPKPPDHPLARLQDLVAVNYTDGDLNMADRVIDEACGNLGLIRDTIDDAPTLNKVWAACFDVAAGWGLPGAAPEAVDDDSGRPFEEVPDEG